MDIVASASIVCGIALTMTALFSGASPAIFFNLPALVLVLGGSWTALAITFPLDRVMRRVTTDRIACAFQNPERRQKIALNKLVLEMQKREITPRFFDMRRSA